MRTGDSSIEDYYDKTPEQNYTTKELLEVIAHELILIRFELQK